MIKAKHNSLYIWFFRRYFGFWRFLLFRKLSISSDFKIPSDQSVLLLQNHFSWWDGYWSDLLSLKVFHRRFHVMMLEDQLRKRMFLNKCGVFTIRKNNRDFLKSIAYTSEILRQPENLVTIYPTGVMLTQHQQVFNFQKGINLILQTDHAHFSIVFAVFLVDYFGFMRPEVRIYLHNYDGERNTEALEKSYLEFYQSCVSKQTE